MNSLKKLEEKSIFILREVKKRFKNPAILWSMGKDSTVLLWLCKKAFYGKIPFKVLHIDTETEFDEVYDFRDKIAKEWKLDVVVRKTKGKFEEKTCAPRKTEILKNAVHEFGFDALIVGIRRDEHHIRNKERYFSPRDKEFRWKVYENGKSMQDAEFSGWWIYATEFGEDTDHVRVHPLLHWNEEDIWEYIKQEQIPVLDMYFSKDGKRFRSVGCKCCSQPIKSDAKNIKEIIDEIKKNKDDERKGRDIDKEHRMEKLRSLGYM